MNNKKKLTSSLLLVGGGANRIDVRYLTGFDAPDPFLVLYRPSVNKSMLLLNDLEYSRGKKCSTNTQALRLQDVLENKKNTLVNQAVSLLEKYRIKHVVLPSNAPASLYQGLLGCDKYKVTLLENPLFPQREKKTALEVKRIRESQRAAVYALKKGIEQIRQAEIRRHYLYHEGKRLTAERVRLTIQMALLEKQCFAEEIIVAGGEQAVDPHERGHGPLPAGKPIILDVFPCHQKHGYWGDITRTVCKGEPEPKVMSMYNTVLKAQQAAIKQIKSGVVASAIHTHIHSYFKEAGFNSFFKNGVPQGFIHGTGHGVGLEIHEAPSIGLKETPLEVGHVVTVEPGLYYPGLGGIRIEDTVVVEEKGARVLAPMSKIFVV